MGRLVDIGDTKLHIEERGPADGLPVLLLHGGPGLDSTEWGSYLDPLADTFRLVLVDQRAQGRSDRTAAVATWTLAEMADDVSRVAAVLGASSYAVLGHSYGAFVALQHAVDAPGAAVATIVSSGVPSVRWLERVDENLRSFEPVELRQQVADSWAREPQVADDREVVDLLLAQLPFHFANPRDPRIAEYATGFADAHFSAAVLRHFASADYGGIDVEDRLADIPQPVLALAGRHDRVCAPEAAELLAARCPRGEAVVFERSGHTTFVEENERYLDVVRDFLRRATADATLPERTGA
jgi:proline iminopeptidase